MLTFNFNNPFPVIETPRLLLRRVVKNDAEQIMALRGDAENMKYIPRPLVTNIEQALVHFEMIDAKIENNGSDLTLYAQPMLSNDDEEEFLPIFGISKNGEIEKLMSKEEVANKLKENLTSPGKWAIL